VIAIESEVSMDKKYIEDQYHLAVLDFKTAKNENEQWEARKTMARLEQIAMQEYGFAYADQLHEKELGRENK
jgi:hypothetical protein